MATATLLPTRGTTTLLSWTYRHSFPSKTFSNTKEFGARNSLQCCHIFLGNRPKPKRLAAGFVRRSRIAKIFMAWQECRTSIEVDVPASLAYLLWSDREGMIRWMPWITSIKVLKDKPALSMWTLKYRAFGMDLEFSWTARNLQPIRNQKIHWYSLDGLPNRGVVRFYPRGPTSCLVELTFSYEVPGILSGVASALQPLVESILKDNMKRFASVAKDYQSQVSST